MLQCSIVFICGISFSNSVLVGRLEARVGSYVILKSKTCNHVTSFENSSGTRLTVYWKCHFDQS